MENYVILDANGIIVNIIKCSAAFAEEHGALPCREGDAIGKAYEPLDQSPAKQREEAYNTHPIIEWDGELLTVTQAATKWQYYAAEGSEKATELQILIAEAKAQIREKYPDV